MLLGDNKKMLAMEESLVTALFAAIIILSSVIVIKLLVRPIIIQKEHICVHCKEQSTIYFKAWALFSRYPILMKDITDEIDKETVVFGIKVIKVSSAKTVSSVTDNL